MRSRSRVNPQPQNFKDTLNEAAVGMVGQHATTQNLVSSMQELRFAQDQGTCTVRHGLIPRQDDAVYVLDLDLYDDAGVEFDVDLQARLLASFNHRAFELFQWFWTPEQFTKFKPKDPT